MADNTPVTPSRTRIEFERLPIKLTHECFACGNRCKRSLLYTTGYFETRYPGTEVKLDWIDDPKWLVTCEACRYQYMVKESK